MTLTGLNFGLLVVLILFYSSFDSFFKAEMIQKSEEGKEKIQNQEPGNKNEEKEEEIMEENKKSK